MSVPESKNDLARLAHDVDAYFAASFHAVWVGPFLKLKPQNVVGPPVAHELWLIFANAMVDLAHQATKYGQSQFMDLSNDHEGTSGYYCFAQMIEGNSRPVGAIAVICECNDEGESKRRFADFCDKVKSRMRFNQLAVVVGNSGAIGIVAKPPIGMEPAVLQEEQYQLKKRVLESPLFQARRPYRILAAVMATLGALACMVGVSKLFVNFDIIAFLDVCGGVIGIFFFGGVAINGRWPFLGRMKRRRN